MRRIISILLGLAMLFAMSVNAFAADIEPEVAHVQSVANRLQEEFPDATIRIVEDQIHIVMDDPSELLGYEIAPSATRTTRVVSSEGGSFENFEIGFGATFDPYLQVYMNTEMVEGLKMRLSEDSTMEEIVHFIFTALASGVAEIYIAQYIHDTFGVAIATAVVGRFADGVFDHVVNLDYNSLCDAEDRSTTGKVYYVKGNTYDGIYSCLYYPWNDNVCETYGGRDATWYEGKFPLDIP